MKRKIRFMNFRLESSLYEELVQISRTAEIPASQIARKGLQMILEQMKQHQQSVWSFPLQGAHS